MKKPCRKFFALIILIILLLSGSTSFASSRDLHLTGEFWLDASWTGSDFRKSSAPSFAFGRARFFLDKEIKDNTFFHMQVDCNSLEGKGSEFFRVQRLWFATQLPGQIETTLGYQANDWDTEYGLKNGKFFADLGDRENFWSDLKYMGAYFKKDFGRWVIDTYVGRNTQGLDEVTTGDWTDQYYMTYGLKIGYKTEKLRVGLFGRYSRLDGQEHWDETNPQYQRRAPGIWDLSSVKNYGIYIWYEILPEWTIKGTYNEQKSSTVWQPYDSATGSYKDPINFNSANQWRVITEIGQSVIKIGSLWLEYGKMGQGFFYNPSATQGAMYSIFRDGVSYMDARIIKVAFHRQINPKLFCYARFTSIRDEAKTTMSHEQDIWTVGVSYQYKPNIAFELQYDRNSYRSTAIDVQDGSEDCVRFRTNFTF